MTVEEAGTPLCVDQRRDDPKSAGSGSFQQIPWQAYHHTYQCQVYLIPEHTGYSVYMPFLPGVVSQGETQEEALENIKEAFRGVVSVYEENGNPIPWSKEPDTKPDDATIRWILVNV